MPVVEIYESTTFAESWSPEVRKANLREVKQVTESEKNMENENEDKDFCSKLKAIYEAKIPLVERKKRLSALLTPAELLANEMPTTESASTWIDQLRGHVPVVAPKATPTRTVTTPATAKPTYGTPAEDVARLRGY